MTISALRLTVQNKETKEFSIIIEKLDFKFILQLNIFGKINPLGDVSLFENIDNKFILIMKGTS